MAKRSAKPSLSGPALATFDEYARHLAQDQDIRPSSLRNYLSDLRLFMGWYECEEAGSAPTTFQLAQITTSTLSRYRSYLQTKLGLKPASVNRALTSLKRYFAWASGQNLIHHDPAQTLKLVGKVEQAPRQLSTSEEEALVAAVNSSGSLRDQTLLILMLHTGLRAGEVCQLKREDLHLAKHKGTVEVLGKGNKYRQVPLNATARKVLEDYLDQTEKLEEGYLFPSEKTGQVLTARALGYLVKKYADLAKVSNVSPHDLRHRFGYRMAQHVPLHRLAQIMGHESLDTTMIYIRGSESDLQKEVEKIAWN